MEPIVEIKNLVVKYGNNTVLNNITTNIEATKISVILGTSGCGKSTLLKSIIGLVKPYSGTVKLFGDELEDMDSEKTLDSLKKIGVLFQNGALLGSLTVAENIALPLKTHTRLNKRIIKEIIRLKLSQVNLSFAENLYPNELSGGMKKRAALARALALDPPLIFCDEPSAGLDPVTSASLDNLLIHLKKILGITIVVVTHELRSIDTIADNVIFLHKGGIAFDGEYKNIKKLDSEPINNFFRMKQK